MAMAKSKETKIAQVFIESLHFSVIKQRYMKIFLFFLMLLISGCAATNDGRLWEKASCNGFQRWDTCMNKAKSICPDGFDIRNMKEGYATQARSFEYACKNRN